MTFNEYQKQAIQTELMKRDKGASANDLALIAKLLGLVGEAGEVSEKFKKLIRDKKGEITTVDKQEIAKELGDVLWYLSALADYLGITLEEVAQGNLEKVFSRKKRGVSGGSGDNR